MENNQINNQSSIEQKKENSEVVFGFLSDFLFEKVNLLNNPGLVTSTSVTSTTTYGVLLRVPDTAKGKYLKFDRKSRLRSVFYFTNNQTKTDCYILSIALTNNSTAPTSMVDLTNYVGIRMLAGEVWLVSKQNNKENLKKTDLKITDDKTHILDLKYNVNSAEILIDDEYIGSISCDFSEITYKQITMYPLFAPIRSTDGSAVQITMENYQFLQDR